MHEPMTSPVPNSGLAPAAISKGPAVKRRALGIASKIWLAVGMLVALSVVSTAVVYWRLADIGRHLSHMSTVAQPVSAAAYEMEINAIGTGMGVLKYLHRADPAHRERFERDQADFERFQRLYRERVWSDEARRFGDQARLVYEDFRETGRRLIAIKDRQVDAVRRFSEIAREINLLIDDDLRAAIDPNSPRAWERVALGKKMRSELAEIGLLLAGYLLGASEPAAVREIREEAHGFQQAVQKRADLATTPAERAWSRDIASAFDRLMPIIDETIAIDRDTEALLLEFVALRTRLDVLLDDEIQIMARAELERSEARARTSTDNATTTLAMLAVLGLVLAVLVAIRLSRSVINPIRALAEGTEKLRRGDWTQRVVVGQRDELGDLAGAFNTMAATLSEKQGALERAKMDLEERVAERTQELDGINHQLKARLEMQRAAEVALLETKEAAELASRTKSEFLANMSHELRTPLNAIIGFSEIMQQQTFGPLGNEAYTGYIADIRDSGYHLLSLINDILDLSKIEAGRYELNEEELDVGIVVSRCVNLIKERIKEASLVLAIDVSKEPFALRADERAVKQMLLNLLSNAVKFTPAGGRVDVGAAVDADGALALSVGDTGIGIAKENLAKVMEPFGQADSSLARKYEGSGLGLPLTEKLIRLHGGELELESEPGRGTRVTLRFPPERTITTASRRVATVAA